MVTQYTLVCSEHFLLYLLSFFAYLLVSTVVFQFAHFSDVQGFLMAAPKTTVHSAETSLPSAREATLRLEVRVSSHRSGQDHVWRTRDLVTVSHCGRLSTHRP